MIDLLFDITKGDIIYDIETFPNVFTMYAIHAITKREWCFEISPRKNDIDLFCLFLRALAKFNCRMCGFNNYNFDYPVVHFILKNKNIIGVKDIYDKAMSIINSYDEKFQHIIWDNDQIVPQLDLFKIHHFDNKSKSTSLKVLEFNMQSEIVEGLPFEVGTNLSNDQIDILIRYNRYDVLQTLKFYELSKNEIDFRETLSKKYNKNYTNHNDIKIGTDYMVTRLEKLNPGCCYKKINGKKMIVQTFRSSISLKEIIIPYIKFENLQFTRILNFFKKKTIYETNSVFKDLECVIKNFKFVFGTGGIHGSVENKTYTYNENYIIEDWDVSSYYPNLAIVNKFYPEHLGKTFCKEYKEVYEQRKQYAKGSSENAMLKLSLNGIYGNSNSSYSCFYDPKYTMSITINGQLLLCMLVEQFLKTNEIELIQINTDGFTIKYKNYLKEWVHSVTKWWEDLTKLQLESNEYNRMFIRDVNNYIAEDKYGEIKRKGEYEFNLKWHQNFSALIIPKAASAYLLNNTSIEIYIKNHTNIFDFFLRTKLPRKYILMWGEKQVQNVTRYYISTEGDILEKIMPAAGKEGAFKRKNGLLDSYYYEILKEVGENWDERIHTKNKSIYEDRKSFIHPGYTVQVCNNIRNHTFTDINYDFYIKKTEELVRGVGKSIRESEIARK